MDLLKVHRIADWLYSLILCLHNGCGMQTQPGYSRCVSVGCRTHASIVINPSWCCWHHFLLIVAVCVILLFVLIFCLFLMPEPKYVAPWRAPGRNKLGKARFAEDLKCLWLDIISIWKGPKSPWRRNVSLEMEEVGIACLFSNIYQSQLWMIPNPPLAASAAPVIVPYSILK